MRSLEDCAAGVLGTELQQQDVVVVLEQWTHSELSACGSLAWLHTEQRWVLWDSSTVVLLLLPASTKLVWGG